MSSEHTASGFNSSEWAAFWRQNGKQVTNYTSIFTKTIRKHPWRDYAAITCDRMSKLAYPGTIKVHTFENGFSEEPPAIQLQNSAPEAMAKAIELFGGEWDIPCGLPLAPVDRIGLMP